MTRRHLLTVIAAAATVIAVVASSHMSHAGTHHGSAHRQVNNPALVAAASRFVTAATGPAYLSTSWSTLAVPALARELARHRASSCRAAAHVVDVSITLGKSALAFVTARCPDAVDGQPIALAWTLKFTDTAAGWRVAEVTS
jgi:hypothetical protein